jgi:hypothetical protein
MAVLSAAKAHDLVNLIELFPVDKLKDHWPKIKGKKEDIAKTIAAQEKTSAVAEFVDRYFSCCKQHIYVFSHNGEIKKLPTAGTGIGERVLEKMGKGEGSALFLYWAEFNAVLTDPFEATEIRFLWPFRFEFIKNAAIVRLIVLEKNFSAQFNGRDYIAAKKVTDEAVIVAAMVKTVDVPLGRADLHKGIKKLWKDDLIDCVRVDYKDPYSTESTTMDAERGIREKKPALYNELLGVPLLSAKFKIKSKKLSDASTFFAKPGEGYLAFPRYSEHQVDTDNVVREILKHNG